MKVIGIGSRSMSREQINVSFSCLALNLACFDLEVETFIFTALQLCRRGIAVTEMSVCPFAKRVNCDKTIKLMPTFLHHKKDRCF